MLLSNSRPFYHLILHSTNNFLGLGIRYCCIVQFIIFDQIVRIPKNVKIVIAENNFKECGRKDQRTFLLETLAVCNYKALF